MRKKWVERGAEAYCTNCTRVGPVLQRIKYPYISKKCSKCGEVTKFNIKLNRGNIAGRSFDFQAEDLKVFEENRAWYGANCGACRHECVHPTYGVGSCMNKVIASMFNTSLLLDLIPLIAGNCPGFNKKLNKGTE